MTLRIIPRLDIKGPNLVKGIHLEGLRVLGKPEDFAKFYYKAGADELVFMDVVASLYNRNSLHDMISRTAKEIFIPLAVGGGIRSLEDIKNVLRAGADKVVINTAATRNPDFIKEASKCFGSSTIIVSIEAIKCPDGNFYAFTDNGRQETGLEVQKWAKKIEELGAGEILITSVDREGTGKGFDCKLIETISKNLSIPLIAHGGAGKKEHVRDLIKSCHINGVCISSLFHYSILENLNSSPDLSLEGNVDFLRSRKNHSRFPDTQIEDLKSFLTLEGIECRHK